MHGLNLTCMTPYKPYKPPETHLDQGPSPAGGCKNSFELPDLI